MANKDLPIKIWIDQDSCWNEKPQGDGYTEYVRVDYHSQALLHVLHKGVGQGKKEMIEKACEWLSRHFYDKEYEIRDDEGVWIDADALIEDLKKAMEE